MGLDQYGYMLTNNSEEKLAQYLKTGEMEERIEIGYWRKHNALHNWMYQKYVEKTGDTESDFNCQSVQLTAEDLDELYAEVVAGSLEPTTGFFFGSIDYMDSYIGSRNQDDDLKFIADAKRGLEEGYEIYYSAWF